MRLVGYRQLYLTRLAEHLIPHAEGRAQCATGVTGGWLISIFARMVLRAKCAIADAIESYATGHHELL